MIKKRYISTLLSFSNRQIFDGIDEINLKYKKMLNFNDKLVCLILSNNWILKGLLLGSPTRRAPLSRLIDI